MDRKSRPREVEVTALKRQPIAVKNPDLGIRPINFNQSRSGGRSSDSEGNNYHRDRLQSGLIPKLGMNLLLESWNWSHGSVTSGKN
ncbi:hypothetical protein LINPERPRIM_LOCUS17694, partial [Linum perenne]